MRGFGAQQEVGVEIDRGIAAGRRVQAHGDGGGRRGVQECIHAQGLRHVGVVGHIDLAERHRLQRLLRHLPQHGGGPVANLLACRQCVAGARRIAFRADDIVQGGGEVRVREPLGHDTVHHTVRSLLPAPCSDLHDRTDPDTRIGRSPEVELMGRRRLELGRHHAADRGHVHDASLGRREDPRRWGRSRGARAFKYSST